MRHVEINFRNPLRSVTTRSAAVGEAVAMADREQDAAVQGHLNSESATHHSQPDAPETDAMANVKRVLDEINSACRERERLRAESMSELAHSSVQLGMRIAKCILGRCFQESSERLVGLIKETLRKSRGSEFNSIKLNPLDCERIALLEPENLWGSVDLELVEDDSIPVGDCQLMGDQQSLRCSLEHQLDTIESKIMEESSHVEH